MRCVFFNLMILLCCLMTQAKPFFDVKVETAGTIAVEMKDMPAATIKVTGTLTGAAR